MKDKLVIFLKVKLFCGDLTFDIFFRTLDPDPAVFIPSQQ